MKPSSSVFDGVYSRAAASPSRSPAAPGCRRCSTSRPRSRGRRRARASSARTTPSAIAAVCDADRYDVAEIGAGAAEIGNPAGAVVKALKAAVDAPGPPRRDEPGRRRHGGDARRQARAACRCATTSTAPPTPPPRLAEEHRDTPIMGRTLLQEAKPTTFGLKAAGWMIELDEAADWLGQRAARRCNSAARSGALATARTIPPRLRVVAELAPSSASTRRCSPGTRCAAASASSRARSASPPARSARPRATSRCSPSRRSRGARARRRRLDVDAAQAQPGRRDLRARLRAAGARPGRDAAGRDGAGARARRRRLALGVEAAHRPLHPTGSAAALAARIARRPRGRCRAHAREPRHADPDTGAAAALVDRALEDR